VEIDTAQVIQALQESQNNPVAAVRRLESKAEGKEAEAELLRSIARTIRMLEVRQTPSEGHRVISSHATLPVPSNEDAVPKGIDAVRRVMREGGVWTAKTMLAELTKRGWEPKTAKHPLPTVEAAINRLFRVKDEIERVGRGEYSYKGFPASPSMETLTESGELN
jgi:hypothetical protein